MENVVFKSKSTKNYALEIVERDDDYELRIEGRNDVWRYAWFSKDSNALRTLIATIREYGHPRHYETGFVFVGEQDGKKGYQNTLGRVMYAAYHRKKASAALYTCIHFKDGNVYNLRRDNLVRSGGAKTVTINNEKYILVKQTQTDGGVRMAITNYTSELFEILDSCTWYYDGHKKSFYTGTTRYRGRFNLPFVVWAYFQRGLTPENWKEEYAKFKQEFQKEDLTIDHKKVVGRVIGKWDCRIENLQALRRELNSAKNSCTKLLGPNCFYIPTSGGAVYGRYDVENGTVDVCKMSNTPDKEEIRQLRYFCKNSKMADGAKYITCAWGDEETIEIMTTAYREAKFYQEVYAIC